MTFGSLTQMRLTRGQPRSSRETASPAMAPRHRAPVGVIIAGRSGLATIGLSIAGLGGGALLLALPQAEAAPRSVRAAARLRGRVLARDIARPRTQPRLARVRRDRLVRSAALCPSRLEQPGADADGVRWKLHPLSSPVRTQDRDAWRVADQPDLLRRRDSGLVLIGTASAPRKVLAGAALAAAGFALVFPALGVVAVGRVDTANRGAALGAFSLFADLPLGRQARSAAPSRSMRDMR